ncbi:MAG: MBL fold metallo-hydrolase [Verrucomicrobiae bacterium]|nr:MBL fold metallo-hydrolase [Verrucomicrobiae bacterium]
MHFHSFARGIDVGAHCYLLELGTSRILLDAGTHPKRVGVDTLPDIHDLPIDSADAILLSHAHLDHFGALPVLCRQFPSAPVFATEETFAVGEALLHNSVNVMTSQRRELEIGAYPLYTHREIDHIVPSWMPRRFGQRFEVGDGVSATFLPAGHVLGAAGIVLRDAGRTIFYTGDVHFEDQSLCQAADFSEIEGEKIDTMIIETTRGESDRRADYTRESEIDHLIEAIRETLARGGSVMLPVFAFGKTQELLMMLYEAIEDGRLPQVPVHIGGLSTKITALFDRLSSTSRRFHQGFRILDDFPRLVRPARKEPEPPYGPGRIYAISSGMMSENTVSNRFAHHFLPNPDNAILFVGYADPETPAGRILSAEPGDILSMNDRGTGRRMPLKCRIEKFDFSGHAPRDQLLDYIIRINPKHAVLVHGDEPARRWFADQLRQRCPHMRVTIPDPGTPLNL